MCKPMHCKMVENHGTQYGTLRVRVFHSVPIAPVTQLSYLRCPHSTGPHEFRSVPAKHQ